MSRIKSEYTSERYIECVSNQIKNNKDFREHIFGARKRLIIDNDVCATTVRKSHLNIGNISKPQFISFLASFSKMLYKQFDETPELHYLNVDFKGVSRDKNHKLYESLPEGRIFYNIDLRSAYWQIGYMLGYIDKKMYLKYQINDDYKQVKRYCVSFLGRSNKMIYYNNDIGNYVIHCNTEIFNNVYKNIRNQLYKCVADAVSLCSEYIEYNIDGVYVLSQDVDKIRRVFDSYGLEYKITMCRKIDNQKYMYDFKPKNFKIK
jgi:hypothetical protein